MSVLHQSTNYLFKKCSFFVYVCFLIANLAYSAEIHYSNDIVQLNGESFKSTLAENNAVIVKFYAPWCRHCQALSSKYSEVADKLKANGSPVICAALDASVYTEIGEHENIQYYPTFRLYKDDKYFEFKGSPDVESILKWIDLKMSSAIMEISTKEKLDELRKEKRVIFVSFLKDNSTATYHELYAQAEQYEGEPMFVSVTDDSLRKQITDKDNVQLIVYKKFDELEVVLDKELTAENVEQTVKSHIIPLLSNFNTDDAKNLFAIKVNVLLFVGNATSAKTAEDKNMVEGYRNAMRETAKSFRGKVAFAHVDSDLEDHSRILEFFDLALSDIPAVRLIKLDGDLIKYNFNEKEITIETLTQFIKKCLNNEIQPYYRSQKLPEDWNKGPVKTLVQSNVISISQDPTKLVLVEFYAPWCGICQRLEPIYNLLGTHFENQSDIIIARVDSTLNEIPSIPIHSFPTIMLFPKGHNMQAIVYDGNRTLESLIEFIESEGRIDVDNKDHFDKSREKTKDVPAKEEL